MLTCEYVGTPEVPHENTLVLKPEMGSLFTFQGTLEVPASYLNQLTVYTDIIPFIRWQLTRKILNPFLASAGTGFEGYLAHQSPEQAITFIANRGKAEIDYTAATHPYDFDFMRSIESFIHEKDHPIASLEIWHELNSSMTASLARFRAERSKNTIARDFETYINEAANRNSFSIRPVFINNNGFASWGYEEKSPFSVLSHPNFMRPNDNQALSYLSDSQLEGYLFMKEIGRTGDVLFRKLAHKKLVK